VLLAAAVALLNVLRKEVMDIEGRAGDVRDVSVE